MKKRNILLPLIVVCCINLHAQQPPLTLWYNQPARKWTDALPVGNGSLGGMIYGGVEEEHIQFNESTLWTGHPRDYQHDGASAWLDSIRHLLFNNKQQEAEALAEKHFMGAKDMDDETYTQQKISWQQKITTEKKYADPGFDDANWPAMQIPTPNGWEETGKEGLDGAVWFRTSFVLPHDWVGKKLQLDLGRIRDLDYTYVNGHLVGNMEGNTLKRSYSIDASLLKEGKNTIAIQVLNFYDKGGFTGIKENRSVFVVYPTGEGPEKSIALPVNWKYFIQDENPPAFPQYQASYQPFGDLYFTMKHAGTVTDYRRSLDISNSVSTVQYTANDVHYKRTVFASNPDQALVIHFNADKPGAIQLTASLGTVHRQYKVRMIDAHTIALELQVKNGALKGVSYLHVYSKDGVIRIVDDKIVLDAASEASFYLVAATNFKNYKDVSADPAAICAKRLRAIVAKTYEQIKDAHINDYTKLFHTFSIDLGANAAELIPTDERIRRFTVKDDPAFLALYTQYARYLMLSCSRANSVQPANLQGLWNQLLTPPWGSKYTTNINLEMNYWPAEILNLSSSTTPLFRAIAELSEAGQKTAKAHYAARGWVLHHNTDLWKGTAPINASNHGIWQTGAAWLCQHIWEHYLFTRDRKFLADKYPVMRSSVLFFEDVLIKDPKTGWLISTPSNSPENGGLVAGPTMDHQIIRQLFRNTIEAAKELNLDQAQIKKWEAILQQIAPNQVGRFGQLQEWLTDKDDTANKHRHVSHLWGVYPGTDITWGNPKMMQAARQSLLYRGNDGTGWSLAWKLNLWARFKDGEQALHIAEKLLSSADDSNGASEKGGVYRNMFDAHPPFQIDGNFGGAAGVAEMLVQSQNNKIELLPALPAALSSGEVKGLCARGGFEVNMRWANHEPVEISILSKAGNDCTLALGKREVHFKTQKGKTYRLDKSLAMLP